MRLPAKNDISHYKSDNFAILPAIIRQGYAQPVQNV